MDVLKLLESKNRCLQKFLELSEDFLASADQGDLSGLSVLENRRDATLKALDLFDRKISDVIDRNPLDQTAEQTRQLAEAFDRKNALIQEILALDERIIARIKEAQDKIVQEISASHKQKDTLSKFKSSWVPKAGGEFDETL